jgi:hypothetical protein
MIACFNGRSSRYLQTESELAQTRQLVEIERRVSPARAPASRCRTNADSALAMLASSSKLPCQNYRVWQGRHGGPVRFDQRAGKV